MHLTDKLAGAANQFGIAWSYWSSGYESVFSVLARKT
jgi:hypothetical protein